MRKQILIAFLIVIGFYFLFFRKAPRETPAQETAEEMPREERSQPTAKATPNEHPPDEHPSASVASPNQRKAESLRPTQRQAPKVVAAGAAKSENPILQYHLENGLMVVHGDMVAGVPAEENIPEYGRVEMSPVELWKGAVIPYHIQPGVTNPERVGQAAAMFEGTAIRLVPYNGEEDALVFEVGEKNCLSYVGRIGGKQPVWIAPGCGPEEIAHEIMHVLGFVHEQNRSDRDQYLTINFDNIEEESRGNFEILPESFMKLSGLGRFDFQSIMIYPPWMFAKSGKSTMEPRNRDQLIQPSPRLSPIDVERINRAYLKVNGG